MVLLAVALLSDLHPWRLRRRNPRVLHDLARILPMCFVQLSLLCRVTPRLGISHYSLPLVCVPVRRHWWSMGFCFLEAWMTVHFCGWNSICHCFSNFSNEDRSCWSCLASARELTFRYSRQSSANNLTSDCVYSGKSLMKVRKSNGPITVPWGTPEMTSALVEDCPSRVTCWVRFARKSFSQFHVFPLTP